MSHLGTTCPGRALPNAINDSGQIVGECGDEAVLFQNEQMVYLKDLVPSTPGLVLGAARSINSSGQIVANGLIGSDQYAFILTPVPEPGAFVLFATAFSALWLGLRFKARLQEPTQRS
jgi:hypothetical protein